MVIGVNTLGAIFFKFHLYVKCVCLVIVMLDVVILNYGLNLHQTPNFVMRKVIKLEGTTYARINNLKDIYGVHIKIHVSAKST
jgi:hypothetical protein